MHIASIFPLLTILALLCNATSVQTESKPLKPSYQLNPDDSSSSRFIQVHGAVKILLVSSVLVAMSLIFASPEGVCERMGIELLVIFILAVNSLGTVGGIAQVAAWFDMNGLANKRFGSLALRWLYYFSFLDPLTAFANVMSAGTLLKGYKDLCELNPDGHVHLHAAFYAIFVISALQLISGMITVLGSAR